MGIHNSPQHDMNHSRVSARREPKRGSLSWFVVWLGQWLDLWCTLTKAGHTSKTTTLRFSSVGLLRFPPIQVPNPDGGFHRHGDIPIAGCSISWNTIRIDDLD